MCRAEHCRNASLKGTRYPNDLINYEWRLVEAFVRPMRRGRHKWYVEVRGVLNWIF